MKWTRPSGAIIDSQEPGFQKVSVGIAMPRTYAPALSRLTVDRDGHRRGWWPLRGGRGTDASIRAHQPGKINGLGRKRGASRPALLVHRRQAFVGLAAAPAKQGK